MPHSNFSPARIWTLATATVTQLMRMKILAFLGVFSVIVVAASFASPLLNPEQQLKQLKDVSFGALQIFSVVIAIVATALLLPRDLEDRTLYTILSKPVPRYEYLLGKLLGVLLLIGGGLILMDAAFSVVLWLREKLLLAQMVQSLNAQRPEDLAQIEAYVAKQGLTWNLHLGVLAIFLKAAVVSALALMVSCFASSTLFTVVITKCVVIIGHGQTLMREFFLNGKMTAWVEQALSALLAILTPDLAVFDIVENVIQGEVVTWGAVQIMLGTSAMYVVGYCVVSHLLFVEKEL
ncbi:ABC transporter permease subunit [Prosthecobacter dejongeii]|uniref:ABC-type Na+ efflux pump permease subunit n=1 Tax=Prosthecobacter dejongeii TaxID=48465 RepID=A0A7W7YGY0_9BACT|nr:ABC transporter permease subunit [Prosthecobacter dejongeii]MBB5035934.1 ABC-type Na+ efflux pump permease subunit [Prosthecobacter dejongeii]